MRMPFSYGQQAAGLDPFPQDLKGFKHKFTHTLLPTGIKGKAKEPALCYRQEPAAKSAGMAVSVSHPVVSHRAVSLACLGTPCQPVLILLFLLHLLRPMPIKASTEISGQMPAEVI